MLIANTLVGFLFLWFMKRLTDEKFTNAKSKAEALVKLKAFRKISKL